MERDRKAEHISLALEQRKLAGVNYFDRFVFEHEALPEIDFDEIDTSASFLGKTLDSPLLISCMTGGTASALQINQNLAAGAEHARVAFGVGSQRKAIEDPSQVATFEVRTHAPSIPILANLGAVQLNYGFGLKECEQAVSMVAADALVFHLNPLQEAIQPEGQRNFEGLFVKMGEIASALSVPVIAKEVGSGISVATARRLVEHGISIIDTAGTGGTSWARIEGARADDKDLGELFADWGIPTPSAIKHLQTVQGIMVIGSGGIRTGLDVAKAIALGADMVGLASPFLEPALDSKEAVIQTIEQLNQALKIAMFCVGVRTIEELKQAEIRVREV